MLNKNLYTNQTTVHGVRIRIFKQQQRLALTIIPQVRLAAGFQCLLFV